MTARLPISASDIRRELERFADALGLEAPATAVRP
jgi:hypothetical protein